MQIVMVLKTSKFMLIGYSPKVMEILFIKLYITLIPSSNIKYKIKKASPYTWFKRLIYTDQIITIDRSHISTAKSFETNVRNISNVIENQRRNSKLNKLTFPDSL